MKLARRKAKQNNIVRAPRKPRAPRPVVQVSYVEAKEWFWIRTGMWTIPAVIITAMALFAYAGEMQVAFRVRTWMSVLVGLLTPAFAVAAAAISTAMPWMTHRFKLAFLPNSIVCSAAACVPTFIICAASLDFVKGDPQFPPPAQDIAAAYAFFRIAIASSAFWGYVYGAWFALRYDKYFIEII